MSLQDSRTTVLQNAATANGNGTTADASGFSGAIAVEIAESAGGTATVTLQGSFDGTNWYSLGYQQTDGTASPARATGGISVLANARHVYQVLDAYMQIRAVISAVAAGGTITAKAYMIPA
jgi:hypothetical protein